MSYKQDCLIIDIFDCLLKSNIIKKHQEDAVYTFHNGNILLPGIEEIFYT